MKNNRKTRKKSKNKGGKAIDSGGFGCVFSPALKCSNKPRTDGISKLSFIENSNVEWNTLQNVKKILYKIPNYTNYFLLSNISTCVPDKLTSKDKENFSKCISLEESGYNATNINSNLNKFKIINMPHGGDNLDNVINLNILSFDKLNLLLQNLLLNAIIPMNKLKIYHFDIKSSNILYKDGKIKIIDFGEMGVSTNKNVVPNILFNRAIQFNSPFSRILFDNFIIDNLTKYFIKYNIKHNTSKEKKSEIIREIYNAYYNIGNRGHELFLKTFLIPGIFKLIPNSLIVELWNISLEELDISILVTDWIVNYCTEAVDKFFNFKTMLFDYNKYFSEIYSNNVDIYGFIMCYMIYIITDSNLYSLNLKVKISNLILNYCFNPKYATKVIPVDLLIKDLKKINNN
jgi:hypothetical protein